jgi:hypothetical protein
MVLLTTTPLHDNCNPGSLQLAVPALAAPLTKQTSWILLEWPQRGAIAGFSFTTALVYVTHNLKLPPLMTPAVEEQNMLLVEPLQCQVPYAQI